MELKMRNSHGPGRAIALGTIIGIVVLALIAGGMVALRSFGAAGQPSYSPAPDRETTEVEGTGQVEFGARSATLSDDSLPNENRPNGVDMKGSKWTLKMGEMGVPGEVFPAPRKVGITTAYVVDWADRFFERISELR